MRYSLFFILLVSVPAFSQSTFVPLNEDYYHWVDRYEIKTGRVMPQLFTSIKPYKRAAIISLIDSVNKTGGFQSAADQFNLEYLNNDSWEWSNAETSNSTKPILKHFYKKKSDFFHVDEKAFDLHINPVLYVGAGKDSRRDDMLFINTRGVEVRGMVDRKVGFYTYLADNQAVLPSYVWEPMSFNPVIPHEGFWKEYKDQKGVDFLHARGYITFEATKHINVQFGHDRLFLGNGYRSLVFSDNAPPMWFLKGNVKVWKINYLFQVNQMVAHATGSQAGGLTASSAGYPNKFNALHHLSINIGKKLTLGVFESVVFHPDDSTNFRLDYLNPIIFYRAIEQQNGSSDNVLLGLDFKWNAIKKLSFYGQFMLDEFVIENIRAGNGWWANKFGIQAGAKYIDAFGLANLDLQGEVNIVRPYTYSHNTRYGNYSGFLQPIAHPLGANFKEMIGIVRYQPLPRLNLTGKLILMDIGRDGPDENWGSDILKDNETKEKEYGNTIGQGAANKIVYASFTASWHLKHNLFIDGTAIIRQSKSDLTFYNNNTTITWLALRWNIPQRLYEF
ncbi:MAG TPA: hypothetical protein VD884_01610 [Ohtaekwangia sp.]|nr:hypothetical protein [Ohtaekwangia sp.]